MNDEFNNVKVDFDELKSIFKRKKRAIDPKQKRINQIFSIVATLLYTLVFYYLLMPALNLHDPFSWIFILTIVGVFLLTSAGSFNFGKYIKYLWFVILILFVLLNLTGLKIFNAKKYSNIINIESSDFKNDIKEIPYNKIPTLDRDSSMRLGSRKMGELYDLVSQFDIDETYTQINYKNNPIRVTPLKYNGFLKYLFNSGEGIPGYITVDIINGETNLVKLDKKIKYSKGDYFFRNINRHTRFKYPFEILGSFEFEIDDAGTPYWIVPTYKNKVGWFDGMDVNGAILVNAVDGSSQKYSVEEIPQWVDRVFEADNIIRQLDWNGMFKNGYWNSKLSQKNALKTTDGYNYLAINDDVYLYTGYTSLASDESNVGFILTNSRTKETKFYPVSSAEEFSAMNSAEGAVQEKEYKATFPLLLNVKDHPTYFLSLKDNAGLIKLYAFIDAQNYQKVSVGTTVKEALENHLGSSVADSDAKEYENISKQGTVEDIYPVVINGNTHYYFTLAGENDIFVSSIAISEKLPFIRKGDNIKFNYQEKALKTVVSFEEN